MNYRRSQRSDRDGSFPEPPCGMGESVSSWGSLSRRKNNRLRRSFQALKCFSLWSKHGKEGARDKAATDFGFPGLDVEDSWESGAEGAEEDFEVRTTSPPHSVDGVFDVSQALQAVPEAIEEEEEESECSEKEIENQEEDAASQGSKPSDYSSEFMTDDSTETSGLPWDSSFSQHGSMESPEVAESRIGIRPFQLPPDLGRSMMADNSAIESVTTQQSNITSGSPKKETGKGGETTSAQQTNANPVSSVKEAEKRDEENEVYVTSSMTFDSETSAGKPKEDEKEVQRVRAQSGDTYSDDMQEVFRVLESARSIAMSLEPSISLSPGVEGSRVKPRREFFAVKSPEPSKKWNSPTRKPGNRVQELMKKFGESPERHKVMTPRGTQPLQEPESPASTASSSLSQRADSFDVPSEIIRHDTFHATESKGFFWRSHPSISKTSFKGEYSETELVDTSISNSEGNRSLDYSDVFSPEELQREYSANGEPSFIHI